MANREFDIILWGSTGFTGRLTATVLARRYGLRHPNIKIALAGRSISRLEDVSRMMLAEALNSKDATVKESAQRLENEKEVVPLIELKSWGESKEGDDKLASELCKRTHVIIAMAGPFAQCGETIVKAAAESGTDYVDITGEIEWVVEMREKYDEVAKENKARILPCCGYDYILNDVSVFCVQEYARTHLAAAVKVIDQICDNEGITISGGTLRTVFMKLQAVPLFAILTGKLSNPYVACSKRPSNEIVQQNGDLKFVRFSPLSNQWINPHIMGPSMKQYILWTNEIKGFAYGSDFIYQVGQKAKSFTSGMLRSIAFAGASIVMLCASRIPYCARRMANAPGEGRATSELEAKGNFVQLSAVGVVHGANAAPTKVQYTVSFDKGEAYMMTAYGVLEAAMTCLKARRGQYPETKYGVSCPTDLLGNSIVDQLKMSGFDITLKETPLA